MNFSKLSFLILLSDCNEFHWTYKRKHLDALRCMTQIDKWQPISELLTSIWYMRLANQCTCSFEVLIHLKHRKELSLLMKPICSKMKQWLMRDYWQIKSLWTQWYDHGFYDNMNLCIWNWHRNPLKWLSDYSAEHVSYLYLCYPIPDYLSIKY